MLFLRKICTIIDFENDSLFLWKFVEIIYFDSIDIFFRVGMIDTQSSAATVSTTYKNVDNTPNKYPDNGP